MSGPTYTYTANVPQASTPFNETQAPILNNFRAINEYVNVNHIGFNNADDLGKHTFLTLPFQSETPAAVSDQITMYTQETPDGPNASEIFYIYPDGTTGQLSNNTSSSSSSGNVYLAYPSTTTTLTDYTNLYVTENGLKILNLQVWSALSGTTILFPTQWIPSGGSTDVQTIQFTQTPLVFLYIYPLSTGLIYAYPTNVTTQGFTINSNISWSTSYFAIGF